MLSIEEHVHRLVPAVFVHPQADIRRTSSPLLRELVNMRNAMIPVWE
jgi:hypothetical protein